MNKSICMMEDGIIACVHSLDECESCGEKRLRSDRRTGPEQVELAYRILTEFPTRLHGLIDYDKAAEDRQVLGFFKEILTISKKLHTMSLELYSNMAYDQSKCEEVDQAPSAIGDKQ